MGRILANRAKFRRIFHTNRKGEICGGFPVSAVISGGIGARIGLIFPQNTYTHIPGTSDEG